MIDPPALGLLGRHVHRSTEDRASLGQRSSRLVAGALDIRGETKVEQLDASSGEQDVCRLQVAMDDAPLVRGLEGVEICRAY